MSDLTDIHTAAADMAAAITAKDAGAVANFYCDDASVLPPGAPIVPGREAIRGFWQTMIDRGLGEVAIVPTEIEILGDHAVDRGVVTGRLGDTALTGKYLVWWKRTAGGWKLYNDIFNFDAG